MTDEADHGIIPSTESSESFTQARSRAVLQVREERKSESYHIYN